jgi:hypothetical protein
MIKPQKQEVKDDILGLIVGKSLKLAIDKSTSHGHFDSIKRVQVDRLGEDVVNPHFRQGIWDKSDSHPTVACFKLTKNRLLLAYKFHLLIKKDYTESDEEILDLVREVTKSVKDTEKSTEHHIKKVKEFNV